jgi:hypothetical protein
MQTTVPASFKPSGGIVAQRTAETVENRTITYPLRSGGILVEECPAWCVKDHASEIEGGIYAEDLTHEGKEVSLSFTTVESERDVILSARITQWPYSDEDGSEVPFMALMPNADSGETLGYLTPSQVETQIRKVEQHLAELRRMNERLIAARSQNHEAAGRRWEQLRGDDIETMPVSTLLRAFGARVVEVEAMPHNVQGFLHRDGDERIVYLLRSLPQAAREDVVRKLFVPMVEGQA